jgi:hypothetical protein
VIAEWTSWLCVAEFCVSKHYLQNYLKIHLTWSYFDDYDDDDDDDDDNNNNNNNNNNNKVEESPGMIKCDVYRGSQTGYICQFWIFHSNVAEKSILVEYNTASMGNQILVFQDNCCPHL